MSDFLLHYVHRRLVFLTSGEVWADPALRTATATTSLPEGRRTHHSHRSTFRYVVFTLTQHHLSYTSFSSLVKAFFCAPGCRMSAASWFNPQMLPLTAVPLSAAVRFAHPHRLLFSIAYLHDHQHENLTLCQYCRHITQAQNSHSICHSRPAALMQSRLSNVPQRWNTLSPILLQSNWIVLSSRCYI